MPELQIDALDFGNIPKNVHALYKARMRQERRGYYWLLFFFGAILFFVSFFL